MRGPPVFAGGADNRDCSVSVHKQTKYRVGPFGPIGARPGPFRVTGEVVRVTAQDVTVSDRFAMLEIGARISIDASGVCVAAEVVAVDDGVARCLPFGATAGIRRGAEATIVGAPSGNGAAPNQFIWPGETWLGRVVDGLGRPIDGKGPLGRGAKKCALRATPPPAARRARLGGVVDFGVRAMSVFTPAREGQRLGLFAAAGVGKSALLSMIARGATCDVCVVALIGERGREVREFIEESLGDEGMARAVVVVATADEPALVRREAAFLAIAVAERFRDQGRHVLCLMDSLTRVAAAQREIGLAAGEPPTVKGYTPSAFSLLPQLLERAGPGAGRDERPGSPAGSITGVFSVLVEGDDHDEPIADAARAALDGHILLSRAISERGRFPAIDVLRSLSRTAEHVLSPRQTALARRARRLAAVYEDMREIIRIGAYRQGANPEVDAAIGFFSQFERFLAQAPDEVCASADAFDALERILAQFPEDDAQ